MAMVAYHGIWIFDLCTGISSIRINKKNMAFTISFGTRKIAILLLIPWLSSTFALKKKIQVDPEIRNKNQIRSTQFF